MHWREKIFFDSYRDKTGIELIYQPAMFRMQVDGIGYSYRPDFYCPKTHCFYEVAGTRQAIHSDKFKIVALRSTYPMIDLRVVNPDGSDYQLGRTGLAYRDKSIVPQAYPQRTCYAVRLQAAKRLREIVNKGEYTLREISDKTGIGIGTLYCLFSREHSIPHLRNAIAINEFMEQQVL